MSQKEIEIILARHLASYLAMPILIVDTEGTLLYYNEPAEEILGMRYTDTGEMRASEWGVLFKPTSDEGEPLAPERLPLVVALAERQPARGSFWIRGLDNVLRHIDIAAFPLVGQADRYLGALAMFWEVEL
ncbi:MAG: PAS domain-containing protein [Chloroflexi bacterium]|nr:PAS domain-containing protein [Chloroflexota bacterium]MBI3732904.1 PAS domain-containing protein [Chloroflexota bacterium]